MLDLLYDIGTQIYRFIRDQVEKLIGYFFELNFFDKLNIINFVPAIFAVAMPVARYYIFETYFYINNPLAVYMIAIVFITLGTFYLSPFHCFIARMGVNAYYLFWVLYLHLSKNLTKAPYELTAGYYVNIAVPILFMVFSLLSYLIFRGEKS